MATAKNFTGQRFPPCMPNVVVRSWLVPMMAAFASVASIFHTRGPHMHQTRRSPCDIQRAKQFVGPFVLDLGDALYAPNCFRDGQGRHLMLGWFQVCLPSSGIYLTGFSLV